MFIQTEVVTLLLIILKMYSNTMDIMSTFINDIKNLEKIHFVQNTPV